jgi:hypothetical protein
MPLLELQNFMNDLVTESPHMGRARSAPTPYDNLGGRRSSKKRPPNDLEPEGNKNRQ